MMHSRKEILNALLRFVGLSIEESFMLRADASQSPYHRAQLSETGMWCTSNGADCSSDDDSPDSPNLAAARKVSACLPAVLLACPLTCIAVPALPIYLPDRRGRRLGRMILTVPRS